MINDLDRSSVITDRLRRRARAWTAMIRAGRRAVLIYRGDLIWAMAGLMVQLALTVTVWQVVYDGRGEVAGIPLRLQLCYAALATAVQAMILPWQFSSLPIRIRRGQVATDLTRPLGLLGQVLGHNLGTLQGRVPVGLAGIAFAIVIGAATPPASAPAVIGWVLALLLGLVIAQQLYLLVSLAAFWTLEIGGPMMLYRFGSAFAAGSLIPLWFMPGWLAAGLQWLPFQAQVFVPMAIYVGQIGGIGIVTAIGGQLIWVVLLAGLLQLVWSRARHRVVVQGG
jgi:ABC-2 type transport system permease protein